VRYLGGKSRLAKCICAILEAERRPGQRFVDVFTGGANIVAGMSDRGPRVANDGCEPLIVLYRAWLDGWRPPAEVSEQLYHEIKARKDPSDPLTAFVGFGCSYGGKWFGTFARQPKTAYNFARGTNNSLGRKLTRCRDVSFVCSDFADLEILHDDLVYCDPPYRGTAAYGYFRGFDYDLYLSKLTEWSAIADVFVSEYAAQADTWEQVGEFAGYKPIDKGQRVERLFRVHPAHCSYPHEKGAPQALC
jgi:DNA adenine methylase